MGGSVGFARAAVKEGPCLGGVIGGRIVGTHCDGFEDLAVDIIIPTDRKTRGEDIESVLVVEVFDGAEGVGDHRVGGPHVIEVAFAVGAYASELVVGDDFASGIKVPLVLVDLE